MAVSTATTIRSNRPSTPSRRRHTPPWRAAVQPISCSAENDRAGKPTPLSILDDERLGLGVVVRIALSRGYRGGVNASASFKSYGRFSALEYRHLHGTISVTWKWPRQLG